MIKVVVELSLDDLGAISALLDSAFPDHSMTKKLDELYGACNRLPWEVISITDERKLSDRIGKAGRL